MLRMYSSVLLNIVLPIFRCGLFVTLYAFIYKVSVKMRALVIQCPIYMRVKCNIYNDRCMRCIKYDMIR